MSNTSRHHRRRGRQRPTSPSALRAIARRASRAQRGCTCNGAIEIHHDLLDGLTALLIHHDDGCPALAQRPTIYPPGSLAEPA
jgi:hypothetical protein